MKNLTSRKLRTILTAGGVAISVGFVVFLISLGMGLQRVSTEQIADLDALKILDVTSANSNIVSVNDKNIGKFKGIKNVQSVEPHISAASKILYKESSVDGVAYGKSLDFLGLEGLKVAEGSLYSSNDAREALITKAAIEQLNETDIIGKEIEVNSILKKELTNSEESKKAEFTLKVVGVIDDENAPYIYMPVSLFQNNEHVISYSGAKVEMKSKEDVDQAKLQIENMGFKVSSVKETVDQINQFFNIFQAILISFGGIAVVVACLGMFNTLTVMLLEKTREVGFMKSLGARKKYIYRLFILESIIIGLLGSISGILVGTSIGYILNVTVMNMAKSSGNEPVPIFYTPILLIVSVISTAVIISIITGFYPARHAAKINPLDALRYE
jgi:putative ABC transport system permease protein